MILIMGRLGGFSLDREMSIILIVQLKYFRHISRKIVNCFHKVMALKNESVLRFNEDYVLNIL